MNHAELTALFRKLGARNPEGWARSQLKEGIPQLARYLFLRQAWRAIVDEGDSSWIDAMVASAERRPNDPFAGTGQALARLRARGATDEELTDLARGMQAQLLFHLCYLLEDPGSLEPEVADLSWGFFLRDELGEPQERIRGLHESVLSTDPTGRQMSPRRPGS